jgi:hypothetical protein
MALVPKVESSPADPALPLVAEPLTAAPPAPPAPTVMVSVEDNAAAGKMMCV